MNTNSFESLLRFILFVFCLCRIDFLFAEVRFLTRNTPELPSYVIRNSENEFRKLINLNGEWEVSFEKLPKRKISVPFCYDGRGVVSCSRTFDALSEDEHSWNYILYAGGINYQAEIKINGNFIVKHEGGYTSFTTVIPENIIKPSGNIIEVLVDNRLSEGKTIPLKNTSNFPKNYGGIYRDIYLIAVPEVFIKSVNISSEIDINLNADLICNVQVSSLGNSRFLSEKMSLKIEVYDTSGNLKASGSSADFLLPSNSTNSVSVKFTLNSPSYWSPDNPNLYRVKTTLFSDKETIDEYITDYGITEMIRRSDIITLNKSEIRLKGVNYIEEYGHSGLCIGYDETERDVKMIKMMGFNVIKLYGRPASENLIHLCNRYGLLIMEELPLYNVPSSVLGTENFLSLAENQLSEMIRTHRNNPCILGYGLGNDFDVTGDEGILFVKKMKEVASSLDNKMIYYSTRNYYGDRCFEYVDAVGFNFYEGDLSLLKEITADIKKNKRKLFISNFGKIVNPLNTAGGYSDPTSLESQSKFIIDVSKIITSSSLQGGFFHSFSDWNSDLPNLRFYDNTNQYMKTSGLFTLYREQRAPAIIMRKELLGEDIPNLNIGVYSKQPPLVFVIIGLGVFIVFIYVSNNVRRFRENLSRALFRPFIFFTDVREQNLIPPHYNLLLAVILSLSSGLFFANLIYFWKDSELLNIMLTVLISDEKIKLTTDRIFNNPLHLTAFLSLVALFKTGLMASIIWLFSLTLKYRVRLNNILTVTVWSLLPVVIMLVIGTFYLRILIENPEFVVIGLIFSLVLYLLCFYRILKGVSVIFDSFIIKVYVYGILTLIFITGGSVYLLNKTKYALDYFYLIMSFLKG
ncbi:MAG: hypothetical protein N2510_00685 [Ignavibacteria bacterium]|nr:hypothetical protein [Ignavibacteria bacterium]